MMRPPNLGRTSTHYCRRLSINAADAFKSNYKVNWSGDAIRKDIMQWMLETNIILGETMANISLVDAGNQRPKTHTFHMSIGDCTITFHDVSILLGLLVDSEPMTSAGCDNWTQLCPELLGVYFSWFQLERGLGETEMA
ncbi:hypothetical protein JHK86_022680 [Glycine max]|nr:hypothetical protein JHK86_022680 [Glycine max]